MDGQILASSLVSLKGTDLRMVYSLLHKTNIGDLLSSKTKDLLSKEKSDHFTLHLEQEVKKLQHKRDEVLQVDLFLEITKLLKLKGTKYSLVKEIEDQSAMIVNEVYGQLQKQDKHFRSFTEKESSSSQLQQMVQYQMSKVFSELDGGFKDFSINDQTKFASQVNDYIQSLPEEKQQVIKEKLGINDLTDEMVRKAIATSGTSIVFAIIVEVSGFAFYTTATSMVATFAGLFGLTLPFGFYTGLTSTIAVLANPLFIIPLLLGGGALLVNHQNKSLKKKLLPIIVMQIALPYMSSGGEDEVSVELFTNEWNGRFNTYKGLQMELNTLEEEQRNLRNLIAQSQLKMKNLHSQVSSEMTQVRVEKQKIYLALKTANVYDLDISPSFSGHKAEYVRIADKIESLQYSKQSNQNGEGLFKRFSNSLSNLSTTFDIKTEEKKLDEHLNLMVEDILSSSHSSCQEERFKVTALQHHIDQLRKEVNLEEKKKKTLESELRIINQNHSSILQQIKKLEKETYGLEDLHV
ncbi:hypothetical protein JOC85_001152 [Bacillus mesophilus]|uniref:Uncharacterized protein n=1 Tax=Bacillus mesophilus TaxID=1808955 RepID=A0A6M0Q4F1_9BACI|nr:hypothetical protein [Bacillus mesophilus]MBM7660385.1 hypothetical protein [Bacillus mesophilus]NEY71094.1 hypothetical protein [Bacillus mesophilus]